MKRFLSIFLIAVMLVGMVPLNALAVEPPLMYSLKRLLPIWILHPYGTALSPQDSPPAMAVRTRPTSLKQPLSLRILHNLSMQAPIIPESISVWQMISIWMICLGRLLALPIVPSMERSAAMGLRSLI